MPMARRRGGVVRTVGRTAAIAGTATAVSGRTRRRQSKKYAAQEEAAQQQAAEQQAAQQQATQQQADAQAQAPQQQPDGGEDQIAQLERLAQLHQQGVLTDDEFAVQKAKILGS